MKSMNWLILFICTMLLVFSLNVYAQNIKVPKKDTYYSYYLGAAQGSKIKQAGINNATINAYEQAIEENFGIFLNITKTSCETLSGIKHKTRIRAASPDIKVVGMEIIKENHTLLQDNKYNTQLLFRYPNKEIKLEKERLKNITISIVRMPAVSEDDCKEVKKKVIKKKPKRTISNWRMGLWFGMSESPVDDFGINSSFVGLSAHRKVFSWVEINSELDIKMGKQGLHFDGKREHELWGTDLSMGLPLKPGYGFFLAPKAGVSVNNYTNNYQNNTTKKTIVNFFYGGEVGYENNDNQVGWNVKIGAKQFTNSSGFTGALATYLQLGVLFGL